MSNSIPPVNGSNHDGQEHLPHTETGKSASQSGFKVGPEVHPQLQGLSSRGRADDALRAFSGAIAAEGSAQDALEAARQAAAANPDDPLLRENVANAEAAFTNAKAATAEAERASTDAQLAADEENRRRKR